MNPSIIAIIDTETSSLDPRTGSLLEVAIALYSIEHRSIIVARSWLVSAAKNEAVAVNGIPVRLLPLGQSYDSVMSEVLEFVVRRSIAFVAHNAAFDRRWFSPEIQRVPWVCSLHDLQWPRGEGSKSLTGIALAHGVGVASAHRAMDDVLTLARLFERVAELGHDVGEMLARGLRAKGIYQALVSYDDREKAKAAGFQWDAATKRWVKQMAHDDVNGLPFKTRVLEDAAV